MWVICYQPLLCSIDVSFEGKPFHTNPLFVGNNVGRPVLLTPRTDSGTETGGLFRSSK